MITSNGLLNYKGLFGENINLLLPDFIYSEPIEVRSKTYSWEIEKHIHTDLMQFFFIKRSSGTLLLEKKTQQFEAPCMIIIPVNTIHGFQFDPSIKGTVLTLSESYLENILQNYRQVLQLCQQLRMIPLVEKAIVSDIINIEEKINQEILEADNEKIALMPLLQLLLITLFRESKAVEELAINAKNPSLKIFHNFQKLIRKSIRETKTVAHYAQSLGISTVHLNRVCNAVVGKSAIKIIHEKLIEEAKRYLLNTDYSISEIGYLLNFTDPAHFTKFFKKYVSASPSEFRKN